jgi:hypothetical protein
MPVSLADILLAVSSEITLPGLKLPEFGFTGFFGFRLFFVSGSEK